jgi:hypothetical protein
MTIEERVRQMLAEAVATEPVPLARRWSGPCGGAAGGRSGSRWSRWCWCSVPRWRSSGSALVTRPGPLPSVPPAVPSNWKSFQSAAPNLKFRYPPDWVVQSKGNITVVPPRPAGSGTPPVTIGVSLGLEPARASAPLTGDPARPACRPDQWRPEFASKIQSAVDSPGGLVIWGDLRYLQGPACHLRTTVHLTVERADGTPVAVPGAPASFTVEADLPEGSVNTDLPRGATLWFFEWDNWCRQPLPGARIRVTADGGGSATRALPPRSIQSRDFPCRPGAPWSIRALP